MKNTIKAITFALVLTFTATFASANGGIIVSDRAANGCVEKKDGIIVVGRAEGIIVVGIARLIDALGIIVSDKAQGPCVEKKDGIIVSDRGGIIVVG
ncbi:MAG: hypothetical protein WKF34_10275 [Pyrinomonadaceae bacterium]